MNEATNGTKPVGPVKVSKMPVRARFGALVWAAVLAGVVSFSGAASGDDWPQFGRDRTRNAVSSEKNPPTTWDQGRFDDKNPPEPIAGTSRNITWRAKLGSMTFGDPVVADGLIWVGTNNGYGADRPDASVLACFREGDGQLLYRYVSPRLSQGMEYDWPYASLACSPLIEGDHIWFITNRAEVVCLDIGPLKRNAEPPRPIWKVDLMAQYGVVPAASRMRLMRLCSIAGYRDLIYLATGNRADIESGRVRSPEAPSLLCLRKDNGEEVWKDNSPGENLLYGQWSSPTVVDVGTRTQCIVGQGDGWVRSFDAFSGEPIWQFDLNRKESKWAVNVRSSRNSIPASPVFVNNHIYIASGQCVETGDGNGRLVCLDPTRQGDISSELAVDSTGKVVPHRRIQAVDPARGEKAISNPNSGVIWEFEKVPNSKPFEDEMHRMYANVAVHQGLAIACDSSGLVHCFDAETGKRYWAHDLLTEVYGSPLIVDGKVYIADGDGTVSIFALSSDPNRAMRILNGIPAPLQRIEREDSCYCSPVFANGVMYLATRGELLAIAAGVDEPNVELTGGYWPQWRGPNRDNVSSETGLLREWPVEGPPRLWTAVGLGEGIASVAVGEGMIFTVGYQGDDEFVVALHEATGELAWATRIGPAVAENPLMRWLSQRVPVIDHDRVYAFATGGDLICLGSAVGGERWRKNYTEDFGANRPVFGFYEQPLIDGDRLVCTPNGSKAQLVFLDKRTGKVELLAGGPGAADRRQDYVATVATEVDGVRQYLTFLDQRLTSIAADDGRLLWQYGRLDQRTANSQTPIVRGDEVFCSSNYGREVALLKLTRKENAFTVAEQYVRAAKLNFIQDSTVLVGSHLYAVEENSAIKRLDWQTGKTSRAERVGDLGRIGFIYADGCLYVRGSEGKMLLVEATPEKFAAKGSFAIPDHEKALGSTMPVVAGGRLYLRDNTRLHCYDVRAGGRPDTAAGHSVILPKPMRDAPAHRADRAPREPRVASGVFVPTPRDVVKRMLDMAEVAKADVVYDLGCGDGRIVIAAAKDFGCRAVGYDHDAELVAIAREQVKQQGVEKLATIERGDLFEVDLSEADVVALYLLPAQNEKLVTQLTKMRPGSRIVTHQFAIPGLVPESTTTVQSEESGEKHTLHLYRLPLAQAPTKGD